MIPDSISLRSTASAAIALAMLAGCSTAPWIALPPAPTLQLLEAAPLVLAKDCHPTGSVIVEFVVLPSGRAGGVTTASAEPCVQQALTAWVGSFRYSRPAQATNESIEWMLVTARKGS
jgi:hypothetical protein